MEEEKRELVEMKIKKKRVPSFGNQNARLHGFYSMVAASPGCSKNEAGLLFDIV